MPRVCISIPTKGSVRAETMEWVLRTFVELAPHVEVYLVNDGAPLQHVRNVQVQRFLASKCSHLFLLDADCVPKQGTIQRLLSYELPITSAPHPTLKGDDRVLMALTASEGSYKEHLPQQGLQMVDAVGGSGLLVARSVFEALPRPWFRCLYDDDGLLRRTEDFYFCEQAKEHGYEIWADYELVQTHIKEMAV